MSGQQTTSRQSTRPLASSRFQSTKLRTRLVLSLVFSLIVLSLTMYYLLVLNNNNNEDREQLVHQEEIQQKIGILTTNDHGTDVVNTKIGSDSTVVAELKSQLAAAQLELAKLKTLTKITTSTSSAGSDPNTKEGYIYHINFAQGCCKTAQKRNCDKAYELGGVDKCLMFDMSSLDSEFREMNKNILTRSRGAGYWLWKPYIILHTMVNIAKPGDYIIYTDSDAENNRSFFDPNEKIKQLLDTQNIVVFPVGLPESDWTKRDAYVLLDMDNDAQVKSSWQMNAVAVVVKNTFKAQRFISEWLTYMQDVRAATDEPNKLGQPNVSGFSQHRHDQSILSLLTKKWKLELHGLKDILKANMYGKS